ncbi:hypothetical protein [Sphingosinicella sp. LY1275]|uniref:hypothetical protein n=1 Tax=Sphingosinicella sp. LY1275 TaxID=3095379 RepID=UPI002ADEE662|nr:hypothetical protein [Sphingosinicella sp. LY1275]MEA1015155.1 hypothetical protein [Sphingosinicella sp. LY1275]
MVAIYKTRLTSSLREAVETWSEGDQDVFLGFKAALDEYGFDVICGGAVGVVYGLSVEFVEPGETPDMVWARVFIDCGTRLITLRVHRRGEDIFLEAG